MLFLLGAKAHPAVRVLIGAVAIIAGIFLHMTLLAVLGGAMVVWGGCTWTQRARMTSRRDAGALRRGGAAR